MSLHDAIHVGGVSEACKYCDHSDCRAPNCACDCHRKVLIEATASDLMPKGPEKACPKCAARRPNHEIFCRVDGTRLASLLCGICGAGMEPEDAFCWRCSGAKGAAKTPDINSPLLTRSVLEPAEPEVDYARQVLTGLQKELSNVPTQQEQEGGSQPAPQRVVEQPAGTQGTFKLVDKPNLNKIRGPARPANNTSRSVVRPFLPAKP